MSTCGHDNSSQAKYENHYKQIAIDIIRNNISDKDYKSIFCNSKPHQQGYNFQQNSTSIQDAIIINNVNELKENELYYNNANNHNSNTISDIIRKNLESDDYGGQP